MKKPLAILSLALASSLSLTACSPLSIIDEAVQQAEQNKSEHGHQGVDRGNAQGSPSSPSQKSSEEPQGNNHISQAEAQAKREISRVVEDYHASALSPESAEAIMNTFSYFTEGEIPDVDRVLDDIKGFGHHEQFYWPADAKVSDLEQYDAFSHYVLTTAGLTKKLEFNDVKLPVYDLSGLDKLSFEVDPDYIEVDESMESAIVDVHGVMVSYAGEEMFHAGFKRFPTGAGEYNRELIELVKRDDGNWYVVQDMYYEDGSSDYEYGDWDESSAALSA